MKRNVELELEAVRTLQEQGVPFRQDEGDSNAFQEGFEEVDEVSRKADVFKSTCKGAMSTSNKLPMLVAVLVIPQVHLQCVRGNGSIPTQICLIYDMNDKNLVFSFSRHVYVKLINSVLR